MCVPRLVVVALPPPRSKAAAAAVRLPGRGRGVVVAYCSRRLLSSGQSTQYHHFAPPAHPPKAHTPLSETAWGDKGTICKSVIIIAVNVGETGEGLAWIDVDDAACSVGAETNTRVERASCVVAAASRAMKCNSESSTFYR